jgi:hypothetical protein
VTGEGRWRPTDRDQNGRRLGAKVPRTVEFCSDWESGRWVGGPMMLAIPPNDRLGVVGKNISLEARLTADKSFFDQLPDGPSLGTTGEGRARADLLESFRPASLVQRDSPVHERRVPVAKDDLPCRGRLPRRC